MNKILIIFLLYNITIHTLEKPDTTPLVKFPFAPFTTIIIENNTDHTYQAFGTNKEDMYTVGSQLSIIAPHHKDSFNINKKWFEKKSNPPTAFSTLFIKEPSVEHVSAIVLLKVKFISITEAILTATLYTWDAHVQELVSTQKLEYPFSHNLRQVFFIKIMIDKHKWQLTITQGEEQPKSKSSKD